MKSYTLITGASSGIGFELAQIAARNSRNLVLVSRDKAKLTAVAGKLKEQAAPATDIRIFSSDLSKPSSPSEIFQYCQQNNLVVNELINNAGFGDYSYFSESNLNRQLAMIDLNVRSLTELTHLFLPAMLKRKSGRIMNLGSVASFLPGPKMSVYFASKSYVLSFSRALGEELKTTGVSVTCLCPGSTKTNFGNSAHVSKTHSTANPKTTAHEVAEYGWRQMQSGKSVAIYGFGNRLGIQLSKFIPRSLVPALVKRIQQ